MPEVIEYEDGYKIINRYNDYSTKEANKAHEEILLRCTNCLLKRIPNKIE